MRTAMTLLLVGVLAAVTGCGSDAKDKSGETTGFTGIVRYHDAPVGSRSGPTGYVLEGDHVDALLRLLENSPMSKAECEEYASLGAVRLYLRMNGSLSGDALKEFVGKKVQLTGTFDVLHVHGIGSPHEHLPVIDITKIEPVTDR